MKSFFKPLTWFCLALVVLLGLWLRPVGASSLVNPRINRLESQVRSLQSQISRLQSQLPRSSGSRPAPSGSAPVGEVPSFDQQFDTLAILIIELQERVSDLEARLVETTESSQ
ncbi:MAG: hypothetical protein AAGI45_06555 [Cyanobacteria bacterium P01_H01_bin.26]